MRPDERVQRRADARALHVHERPVLEAVGALQLEGLTQARQQWLRLAALAGPEPVVHVRVDQDGGVHAPVEVGQRREPLQVEPLEEGQAHVLEEAVARTALARQLLQQPPQHVVGESCGSPGRLPLLARLHRQVLVLRCLVVRPTEVHLEHYHGVVGVVVHLHAVVVHDAVGARL